MSPFSPTTLLVLVPLLPLLGAICTILLGRRLGARGHLPAVAGIAGAALVAGLLLVSTVNDVRGDGNGQATRPVEIIAELWQWATVDDAHAGGGDAAGTPVAPGISALDSFSATVTLRCDPLTSTLLVIITGVGLLVAIYSIGYMHDDPGYPRFFALVAMFVFSMSMLVAASNFLLVYVFWEAVGACSYLLIGFWFTRPEAARAAKKAFLVNRVGDFGLAIATFLLWMTYGTLDFHDTWAGDTVVQGILGHTRLADAEGFVGGAVGTAICLLILLAACGKSAQLPLHVWLPDAMEGPTPASALIHAATMVTAGIYLITRSAPLFVGCPGALAMVSIVGATTALVAAGIATVQNDLKRVLAYSTISQLGYMFASLGTGSMLGFTAAIFHLVTHAFFKALLFLGAGSVMHSMGGVIDMRRFGGLRQVMPVTAATFLIGACALAGLPPFAGFFSKDEILAALHAKAHPDQHHSDHADAHAADQIAPNRLATPFRQAAFASNRTALESDAGLERVGLDALDHPSTWQTLFWMSLFTAGLTAFYTFRAVFMTFTGPKRVPTEAGHHPHESPTVMTVPLMILAGLSLLAGWVLFATGGLAWFLAATPSLTAPAIVRTAVTHAFHVDLAVQGSLAAAIGIAIAAIGHLGKRSDSPQMERFLGPLGTLLENKFYFDAIYKALIVRPLEGLSLLSALIDRNLVDGTVDAVARVPLSWGAVVRRLQSGLVQRYALAGVVGVLAIVLALAWQLRP
ncbi:MAG: NADH-quinone oxidoreductase subunit L [Planctomycetota bacterium]|nr:MAG: NADH-quinone oxidoreductase subunit L [Planctomycetota bacterium]